MTTAVQPPEQLVKDVTYALKRLREARADGDPDHKPHLCKTVCVICIRERNLDRLLEKLPRQEKL